MKLTEQQLNSAENACKELLEGFRSRRIAHSFKEFKQGGKQLRYAGPRLLRNMWILVKEVQQLRKEREQMVAALKAHQYMINHRCGECNVAWSEDEVEFMLETRKAECVCGFVADLAVGLDD